MSAPHVYNMPSGVPFLENLAKGLRTRFGEELQSGLILLPTRRAVRGLGEAFVTAAIEDGIRAAPTVHHGQRENPLSRDSRESGLWARARANLP